MVKITAFVPKIRKIPPLHRVETAIYTNHLGPSVSIMTFSLHMPAISVADRIDDVSDVADTADDAASPLLSQFVPGVSNDWVGAQS